MLATLYQQFQQHNGLELAAVLLAVAYLLLAVREHRWCWYAAFASTLIFLQILWDVRLYMESVLQVYYLAMAAYGWWLWRQPNDNTKALLISTWPWQRHVLVVGSILLLAWITGVLLAAYTDARLPYIDAFTTWASIVSTYMVTRKILENWIYWLVIDTVSIYLYLDRALYFTALLFGIYILIIGFGWYTWRQRFQQQTQAA